MLCHLAKQRLRLFGASGVEAIFRKALLNLLSAVLFSYLSSPRQHSPTMADPFSIAVGVVGIVVPALHGTHILIDDVNRIIDAPAAIQTLREHLESTVLGLESLKAIPEPEWQSLGSAMAEQSKAAVKTCGSACDNFRNDLQRWTRRSRGGELSWRDRANVGLLKEKQIKAMSGHLQSCKLTCNSVVGMATLCGNPLGMNQRGEDADFA